MKKNIAIVMGGYSSEYHISIKSGSVVKETLDSLEYNTFPIHIYKDKWVYVDDSSHEVAVDKNDFSIILNGRKIHFDCVFNTIHGSPGEDGIMHAYFKIIGIPLTGCPMYQAALTFNKRDLLATLKPYGIKMAPNYCLNLGDTYNKNTIIEKVGLPCFVKANKAGSSYGITKVYKKNELEDAINKAFEEDDEIIIESYLDGVEVSVGVITYKEEVTVLPITEIVSENDFFDYAAKYEGKSQEITPARISKEWADRVSQEAKRIYEILQMTGFSRSEFIFKDGEPHLLEVNTVPGLTKESILPQQATAAGISLHELFENAIKEAMVD